ncbi:MAG TPA: helix-turn-helix domain-containing protein [Thermoplasmata archaeon]|nr:helix-turn-helix domain-containing protein [Thermoplasmata archaeon]
MIEATLRITLPCSWVTEVTREHGATVNLVEQKPAGGTTLQTLVEIDPGEADPTAVVETLRGNRFVHRVEAIVPPKGKILATLLVDHCDACQALANSDAFLTDATATPGGGLEWHLLAPTRPSVEALVRILKDRGIAVELAAIRSARGSGSLTERQERVLSLAFELGYFDFPKKIGLTELARKLGVSKAALSETLRTGEEKILHGYFQGLMKRAR